MVKTLLFGCGTLLTIGADIVDDQIRNFNIALLICKMTHTRTHTRTHAHAHAHTHTHIHTHTHTHINVHTHPYIKHCTDKNIHPKTPKHAHTLAIYQVIPVYGVFINSTMLFVSLVVVVFFV